MMTADVMMTTDVMMTADEMINARMINQIQYEINSTNSGLSAGLEMPINQCLTF